ncbi:MAG: hypothetical protein ABIG44_10610 [Planctomycetota bacterium]
MTEVSQELMTPHETARWFRRSPSWLRQQTGLLRLAGPGGQPLYHVRVCRAYVLGRLCGLLADKLHNVQIRALAAACGLSVVAAGEALKVGNPDDSADAAGVPPEA